MPKICCVVGLSLIWKRGSSIWSVESMRSNRPSSGVLLTSAPKLTRNTIPLLFWESSARAARVLATRRADTSAIAPNADATKRRVAPEAWGSRPSDRAWFMAFSFHFMDVIQDSRWYADGEDSQLADGLVAGSPRNVDDDSAVQLDDLVVDEHRTLTIDDVIEFVG